MLVIGDALQVPEASSIELAEEQQLFKGGRIMIEKRRSDFDRRLGGDRRKSHNSNYLPQGGVERRMGKERRSQFERRQDWLRINKWLSVLVHDLKWQN